METKTKTKEGPVWSGAEELPRLTPVIVSVRQLVADDGADSSVVHRPESRNERQELQTGSSLVLAPPPIPVPGKRVDPDRRPGNVVTATAASLGSDRLTINRRLMAWMAYPAGGVGS